MIWDARRCGSASGSVTAMTIAKADPFVQVRVGEESLAVAAGLRREVRRPEAFRLGARAQLRDQLLRRVVLSRERGLCGIHVLLHERPVALAELLEPRWRRE